MMTSNIAWHGINPVTLAANKCCYFANSVTGSRLTVITAADIEGTDFTTGMPLLSRGVPKTLFLVWLDQLGIKTLHALLHARTARDTEDTASPGHWKPKRCDT